MGETALDEWNEALKKITIHQPDTCFHECEVEVLIEGSGGWHFFGLIESENNLVFVHRPVRTNGTPRTYKGSPYYEVDSWFDIPPDFDLDHWATMVRLGLP